MTETLEKTYSSCFELPLYNFIKISLHGESEKYGVTADGWAAIVNEYSELSGNKDMSQVFQLTRQITYLTNRLNIIQLVVNELTKKRIPGFIEILQNDLSFNLKFDDLQADLNRVVSLSKSDVVKLQLAQMKYDSMQKKGGHATTEADWYDEMAVLAKFQAYAIKPKETTVAEYLAIKKAFKAHNDYITKNSKPYGK